MDITFSARNNAIVLSLPIVPPDIEISEPSNHEKFETVNNGTILLIGEPGLRELTIDSFFPKNKVEYMKPGSKADPMLYRNFFTLFEKLKEPIRVVMTLDDGTTYLNMPVKVTNFKHRVMRNGDMGYVLPLIEYKFGAV